MTFTLLTCDDVIRNLGRLQERDISLNIRHPSTNEPILIWAIEHMELASYLSLVDAFIDSGGSLYDKYKKPKQTYTCSTFTTWVLR